MELFLEEPTLCVKQSSRTVRCTVVIGLAEECYWGIQYAQEPSIPIILSKSKKYIVVTGKGKAQEQALKPSKHCVKHSLIRSQSLIGSYEIVFYNMAKNSLNLSDVPEQKDTYKALLMW
jgi:hypothetical protein